MKRTISVLPFLGILALFAGSRPASAADFKIVVHSANSIDSLKTAEVGQLFLKKNTRWENGSSVEPVDQASDSTVRVAFSEKVHGKTVSAIKSFWQRQIYSGRGTPPPELSSDSEIVAFIRTHPSAIGYVSAGASVGDGVKLVRLSD